MEFYKYEEPKYEINTKGGVIIGRTEIMIDLFHYLNHLADLPTTVLLRGKTGTGKELCAKALHYNGKSRRKEKNFVAVNCAGIPSELLESELFGYVKGAFTGAYRNTQGKFQYANEGTILLDEIGDMEPKLQAKILRVLQERQITKIGSNKAENISARIIAATNKNLEEKVERGEFREDLFYRLNVIPIKVPALKERREDIPLIAQHFIEKYNEIYNAQLTGLSYDARERLKSAEWKGNARELESAIERICILKKGGLIEENDLCLNSNMPRRRLIRHAAAGKQRYKNGILPISPMSLSELDGSKSYSTIIQKIHYKKIYAEKLGLGKKSKFLMYLTPQNARLFFEKETKDYEKVIKEMETGEFNQIARNPFAFFNVFHLKNNPCTFRSNDAIRRAIKRAIKKDELYQAPFGSHCYALTEENASYFVPRESGRDQKIAQLRDTIRKSYEQFNNWKAPSF